MNTIVAEFAATPFNTAAPLWQPGEDDTFECVQVRDETHDVKTFVFKAVPARQFRYLPGQFITLELEIDGEITNRCYTLSSTPTRPDCVSITVKRVPGGKVSNWLHDNLKPGSRVSVLGPAGEFSFALYPQRPYLFLSGGSGITPLMSMSRALTDLAQPTDIVFVHSSRSPSDIIFRHEVVLLARQHPGFRQVQVCQGTAGEPEWSGLTGYLDRAALERSVPDFKERTVFCCGPGPYMAGVRKLLEESGFDMAHYHEESFNFGELTAAAGVEPAPACEHVSCESAGFKVRFSRTGDEITVAAGQTVLAAAQASGLRLPASCSQGLCGTCKSKLVEGQVDMQHSGGIRKREIDQGMFLPCCSKPLSDLVIDR
ncbi:FAD-binding oxidoreductase [Crenobacter sp. SG2305]|uniref:hybrid-cluster NAD(P)-dependent oxidoreductase n=1 Tax=Crenobacter oryzisoli TaxID=3056844 RepID=UPI0025AA9721|nr:hybrid-cluster NAD(P)-dependent oxidoreductase [Crenobacter sp. SG2305]MDN0085321.1 FAD-binding oxidoreductase [Crenobacter sp. SG2305]